jgi:hypothetical protein
MRFTIVVSAFLAAIAVALPQVNLEKKMPSRNPAGIDYLYYEGCSAKRCGRNIDNGHCQAYGCSPCSEDQGSGRFGHCTVSDP